MRIKNAVSALVLLAVGLLAGCGGGSGGTTGGSGSTLGYFLDAAVGGITYSCTLNGQAITGVTANDGAFNCTPGSTVTFSIGKITLGSTTSAGVITPINLAGPGSNSTSPAVQTIVQLLLSLDPVAAAAATAGTPVNSITISPAVLAAANNLAPITIGATTNQAAIDAWLASIGAATNATLTSVTPTQATTHLNSTMNGIFQGAYSGSFAGAFAGTWSVTIDALGNVTGTATDTLGGIGSVTGAVTPTLGAGNGYSFTGTGGGTPWAGTLDPATGNFSGTWDGVTTNTYTGRKAAGGNCPAGQVLNPLMICVPVPAGATGGATTPTVTGFSPTTGAVGSTVTITGTNLGLGFQPAPIVKFGATDATALTLTGQTSLTVTIPAGLAAGGHTITIGGATGTPITVGTYTVTQAATVAPIAPANVTATAFSATQINLSWTAVTGAANYNVYRSTATGFTVGAASKINTTPITVATFNSTGLFGATAYFYVATAVNSVGESIGSTEVSATTSPVPAGVTVPTTAYAPQQNTNLQLAMFNTVANPPLAGQIRVFSSAAAASETINIYRSTSPNVAITPANLVTPAPINTKTVSGAGSWWFSFDDTGLAAGTKYYYRTTLVNAAGEGPGSIEIVGRTPLATIGAGAGLTLSAAFKGKTTVPNMVPYEYSYSPAQFGSYFSDVPSRGFTVSYQFDAINGDLLEFGLIDTVGGTDNLQMDVTSALKKCAITTVTGYTACSTLGVTIDRAAGSITFANTPMKATTGATIGSMLNISGTLNFTPF